MTDTLNAIEQKTTKPNAGIDRNSAEYKLGVYDADRKKVLSETPIPNSSIPRRPDGRVDITAMNAANCPDVDHGGREEDCQDNDEGA